jgi:hypothetical protein
MVLVAMVNMLLLVVGFLNGLRKKSPVVRGEAAGDSAKQTCTE